MLNSYQFWTKQSFQKILALVIVVILGIVVIYGLWVYLSYFLSALVLYVLFYPLFEFCYSKLKLSKTIAALVVITITLVTIVTPLVFMIILILNEVQGFLQNGNWLDFVEIALIRLPFDINLQNFLETQISNLTNLASNFLLTLTASVNFWFIGILLTYFTFYFLLVTDRQTLLQIALKYIPFNRTNVFKILTEFKTVTFAVLLSNTVMAIIQGTIFGLAFWLANLQSPIIWGFIAAILSFLPIVGPIFVVLPAIIIFLLSGYYYAALIMVVLAIVLTLNDSFLRPIIQSKLGHIHPLVSVSGFILGVSLFGMIGIVVGPILLSYFLTISRLFIEEHLS
jgi:predicted PurR-regulated permease PerM